MNFNTKHFWIFAGVFIATYLLADVAIYFLLPGISDDTRSAYQVFATGFALLVGSFLLTKTQKNKWLLPRSSILANILASLVFLCLSGLIYVYLLSVWTVSHELVALVSVAVVFVPVAIGVEIRYKKIK